MTNCAKNLTRLIAMLIMVCTIVVATVSCDKLPFDFEGIFGGQQNAGGENTPPDNEQPDEEQPDECTHESKTEGKCDNCGEIFTITIAEAIEIAAANPAGTAERYYIRATVKTISNPSYGEMTIEDETGEIYVYGTYSFDGALSFTQIDSTPVKGDEVLLHCILSQYEGKSQVKNARLIEFVHNEVPFDESQYTKATIAEARNADTGAKVIISGTVAQITYSDGNPYVPSGVILVDDTSSIYVYGVDVAGQVKVGNTVTVAGDKAYWIRGDEVNNAQKFGYTGSCQLENATVISKDAEVKEFDKSWITETTVKEIMDTPFSENITNKIFKVNALVKKAPGNGYTNYYINDIDGTTGSYTYTQCNGNDFGWLDQFDGKICTVYMVVQNAKSTGTGCVWRLLPIEVIDEGYEFDVTKAAEYAVKYHGIGQFLDRYTGDPAITLNGKVDSALLDFEGATLSYTSSNEAVVYFTEEDGVVTFHCGEAGKATVTVSATHGENTYSEDIEIVVIPNIEVDYVEVKDAIAAEVDSTVTVKGIVGPSVVNKKGFYFFGEDGSVITVLLKNAEDFSQIAIGNEIILTGRREHHVKDTYNGSYVGQACIMDAEIIANYYGNHSYSTAKFVTGKTVDELRNLDIMTDYSTTVFVTQAKVMLVETGYYTSLKLSSIESDTTITLYCSSANDYSWLKAYAGQTVTLELAACNWNDKSYWAFCALALVNEDGSKILNTLNFVN